jgi:RNA cap guanine-N2 methyltransferase
VADKITWFKGDCFEILGLDESSNEKAVGSLKLVLDKYGVIFVSPPWGGVYFLKTESRSGISNMS